MACINDRTHIYIFPIDFEERYLLECIGRVIEYTLHVPSTILERDVSLRGGWHPSYKQINASWVLTYLKDQVPSNYNKILGITEYDLYRPVLTYVFGAAELNGRTAIVSTHRFRSELYGLAKNQQKLKERLIKETMHELGHSFGLIHCRYRDCVMLPSTYVEEIDSKPSYFCPDCAYAIRREIRANNI